MNQHKLRAIIEFVRGRGPLPTDQFGEILDAQDLLAWFGLTGTLSSEERTCVSRELAMMREAHAFIERLQLKTL